MLPKRPKHFVTYCAVSLCTLAAGGLASRPLVATPVANAVNGTSHEIFRASLPEVPGKQLVVVALKLPPTSQGTLLGHRHPGSVYVHVTEGTARLGLEGQAVQQVRAGEGFFEPAGVLHTVAESDSATAFATALAVMIVPDGAPLVVAGR